MTFCHFKSLLTFHAHQQASKSLHSKVRGSLCCGISNDHALFAANQWIQDGAAQQVLQCAAMNSGHHCLSPLANVLQCSNLFCIGNLIHNHHLQMNCLT